MDFSVTISLAQIIGGVLAFCGVIITLSSAITVIVGSIKRFKAPEDIQNGRIDALEIEVKRLDGLIVNDSDRMKNLEEGNRITQKAILALLSHGIDGNDIAGLKNAKADMESYLIGRK